MKRSSQSTLKHGLSYTPEYRAWQCARHRCTSPESPAWEDYGGRGVRMCDNNGHYEPGNCRWVLRKVNDRNRRSNRSLTFMDETRTLAEWCERLDLPRDTVRKRLESGWTVDEALTVPVRPKASSGHAKDKRQNNCLDCDRPVYGVRCKSCENRRRAIVRANYVEQREEIAA